MHKYWTMFLSNSAPTDGADGGGGAKPPSDSFDDADDDKGDSIPRARFNEAQRKNRQKQEALQRELDELRRSVGTQPRTDVPTLDDLERQLSELQDLRDEAIFDGERDKAKGLNTRIRQLEKYLRDQQVEARTADKASATIAQREYTRALDAVYKEHSYLNDKSDDYDEKAANRVARYVRGAISDGMDPSEALREAIATFYPEEKEDKQVKRDRNARQSALDTANRQPPASGKGGKAQPSERGPITEAMLEKMSDQERRLLRGDILE